MASFDLTSPLGRFRTYLDYLWKDHAYLRVGFQNAHWVGDNLIRTNQPWPFQLKWWRDHFGVRTVINLRGGGYPTSFYLLEKDACARLGLKLEDFAVSSREAPTPEQVLGAIDLFKRVEYPAVMHCKSGADRAGIMSVLYAHLHLGQPLRAAIRELSFRTLHVKAGKTGVLDYTFERYFADGEPKGLSFVEWVQTPDYDPVKLKAEFQAGMIGSFLTETLLKRE